MTAINLREQMHDPLWRISNLYTIQDKHGRRVFMSTARPVEFVPTGPEDVQAAEQQTAYAQYAFSEANGYKLLYSVFHDALVKAPGTA